MIDRTDPEDREPGEVDYERGAYDEGFDDQPIDETESYEDLSGFDDEPLDYDAYDEPRTSSAPAIFGGQEYDSENARALRTESLRRVRRGSGGALFAGLLVVGMLVAIPVLALVAFVVSQQQDPNENQVVSTDGGPVVVKQSGPPQKIAWSDAAAGATQKIGGKGVKVLQVSVGKARARDASNQVVFTGNEYLRISIEVESFQEAPYEYVSFYGREMELFDGPDRVRLYDASDAELAPHVFGDVRGLEGHTPRATLDTRDTVRDALYFDMPKDKSVADLGELRLTIPFEGAQSTAHYGFRIPSSMIVEEDDSAVDPTAPLSAEDLKALTAEEEEEMDDSP